MKQNDQFLRGIVVGVGAAVVAAFTVGLARHARQRFFMRAAPQRHVIDGINPPEPIKLETMPQREGNLGKVRRLESEAFDVSPVSQRW